MLLNILKPLFDLLGIKHSPNLPRILNNAAWLFLDNGIRFVLGFWVISWMARYLGPSNFGLFNYALSVVSIFSIFAILGLNEMLIRMIVSNPSQKDDIITTAFFLRCITGAFAFLLCWVLINILNPSGDITRCLVGIIAFGLIFQAFDTIDLYFQSQLQSKYTVFAKNSAFIVLSFIKIYLIVSKAPLITFAWAALAEIILGALGLVSVYYALGHKLIGKYSRSIAKNLMSTCWPIWKLTYTILPLPNRRDSTEGQVTNPWALSPRYRMGRSVFHCDPSGPESGATATALAPTCTEGVSANW